MKSLCELFAEIRNEMVASVEKSEE
jgi:hypothetical protein